MPGKKAEMLRF